MQRYLLGALLALAVTACSDDSNLPGPEASLEAGADAGADTGYKCGLEGETCAGMCLYWRPIMQCVDCPMDCTVVEFYDCGGDGRCYCDVDPTKTCDAGPADSSSGG